MLWCGRHPTHGTDAWREAVTDGSPAVRRRAAELAPALPPHADVVPALVARLTDADVTVVEAAAWALGELGDRTVAAGAVDRLAVTTTRATTATRSRARRRSPRSAALGDARALPAILAACHDKPAVRRRAVLALAPFEGPEVDAAVEAALGDRDWQVRQAAEDLRDG